MKGVWVLVLIVAVFFFSGVSFAATETKDGDRISKQSMTLEERVEALENNSHEHDFGEDGEQKAVDDYAYKFKHFDAHLLHREIGPPTLVLDGFRLGVSGTIIFQGAHNATFGSEQNPYDASFSADITAGKIFKDITGKAFLHLEVGEGAGLEDNFDVYSNVNRDASVDNHVQVTELWYQQGFADIFLAVIGKYDPTVYFDFNTVANDETNQFLGWMFRNNPTIEFPNNNIGIRLALAPGDLFELGYGLFVANPDFSNFRGKVFNIGQAALKPKWGGMEGNYRALAWLTTTDHTKWSDPGSIHNYNYGFGVSIDQQIIEPVTIFARYGWANPAVYDPLKTVAGGRNYAVAQSWSGGVQVAGGLWKREDDVLALAVGQNFTSSQYRSANPGYRARAEGHFEIYYNCHVNKHLALSPDYQMIWNPFGGDTHYGNSIVSVFGLRTQIDI